ncbi:MAG: GEVED domain-containing protein, partial [Armatimonadetes bacterium]|nr:GEVED domain-containing protein [Armatimonadota bacterium]
MRKSRSIVFLSLLATLVCLVTMLGLGTAASATPYFLIDSQSEWLKAQEIGRIQPMTSAEWSDYMFQWAIFGEGEPYPTNEFIPPELYVWGGGGGGLNPEDAGLVMVWRPGIKTGSFSSAWKYNYGLDPDLTGCTINIQVTAPQFSPLGNQVNNVSFGIQDINGNIRSWQWQVGAVGSAAPIWWNTPTNITINPMILSVNATIPVASGFANNPAFNIVNSQLFIVDENAQWVANQGIPPPGQQLPAIWNYWHNLVVTPPILPKTPLLTKWSQPVVEIAPGLQPPVFNGWDEKSLYMMTPICADDWLCEDNRPVTDIHWWGSFIGWTQPDPPQMPSAFHIGIWTDVPVGPNNPFSHPGMLVWENFCNSYEWNFAGYDKDPRGLFENETCFQFNQYLTPDQYFYQDPGPTGKNIYWLSIAAIDLDGTSQYPWGWKTRPHFFQDDAVRIQQTNDPAGFPVWPPMIGSTWAAGTHITHPLSVSWDLAFELSTNEIQEELDFGDAPDRPYPTLLASNGARHIIVNGFQLGQFIDAEPNGQPDPNALGDDNNPLIGPDDEDGVTFISPLQVGQTAQIIVNAAIPVGMNGKLDAWVDFNNNGIWTDAGEQIFTSTALTNGNTNLTFTVPTTAVVGPTFARFRLTDIGGQTPVGLAQNGEVEDYEVFIEPAQPTMDFGDAPDPLFPTLLASDGARHLIGISFRLGQVIDAEYDGQPNATATGDDINPAGGSDDEDGVTFVTPLIPGAPATVNVNVMALASWTPFLDVWIDFTNDGTWATPGDQIFTSQPVVNGLNTLTFNVPATAAPGSKVFARFRLSNTGGLSFTGYGQAGEVEDYQVPIGFKWTQEPDLSPMGIDVNATMPYILADDFQCTTTGPITDIHLWGSWLYDELPMDATGKPRPDLVKFTLSIHEDVPAGLNNPYSHPGNLLWLREFQPGQFGAMIYAEDIIEGWMNPPDMYLPFGDHVCWEYDFLIDHMPFFQTGTPQNPKVYWLDVQAMPLGINQAFFGWKTSVNHWNDDAVWGEGPDPSLGPWNELRYPPGHQYHPESIDLAFAITGKAVEEEQLDWGDAPDNILFPSYPTLAASNGANHKIVSGFCLGQFIDAEPDGQPNANATGDDINPLIGPDDEDGVFFLTPLVPGQPAIVNVIASAAGMLDVWVDFNGNG